MISTSSSEEDECDLPGGQMAPADSGWKNYDYRSVRALDLRSKPHEHQTHTTDASSMYARISAVPSKTSTLNETWQPLNVERSRLEPQRPPPLSAIASNSPAMKRDSSPTIGDGGTKAGATNQFSVSFEGISESGPIGTRLSPVGSSCWSSEQHISPDLSSLMSGSTNSVSAGLSLSSGRQHGPSSIPHRNLYRQPSYGTGGSGGGTSVETGQMQSTSVSVRSAPFCLGSPIRPKSFQQLKSDTRRTSKTSAPTPPSLAVSDPEEELHKRRLQIYVFSIRCVAYPILSPVSQGSTRRYLRVTKDYLATLKERFQQFLKGDMAINCDEAFRNAISDFYDIVLESDRIASMVKSGSCSMYDIREIFITNIEKRFQNHQLIEGLSKESVISAWKIKFDQICRGGERPCPVAMKLAVPQPEIVTPTKEQLYELLMRTLSVEKYEHQILYNACQLDNVDEQAAQLRRELSERLLAIEKMSKDRSFPKLVHKEMETQYIEEEKLRVNELIRRLDSIPVLKSSSGSSGAVPRRFRKNPIRTILPMSSRFEEQRQTKSDQEGQMEADLWSKHYGLESSGVAGMHANYPPGSEELLSHRESAATGGYHGHGVNREAVRLNFTLEVYIHQLRNIRHLSSTKKLYCIVELEGVADRKRTESVEASKPVWNTTAEFETYQPLPSVKLKVYKECSGPLAIDDKEMGKVVLFPTWSTPRVPEWYKLQTSKHCHDNLELQVTLSMLRPTNCKYASYCWIQGRTAFKKWKRRYICLTQVSQFTFLLAAYGEQKSQPAEFLILDSFTVDYCESRPDLVLAATSTRPNKPAYHGSSTSLGSLSKLRFGSLSRMSSNHRTASAMSVNMIGRENSQSAATSSFFFFKLVREGDSLIVAAASELDRQNWVQAIYRATGQTHKPSVPVQPNNPLAIRSQNREIESHQPIGIEELATLPAHGFDHLELFTELQARSLDQRLQDSFVSLGWPSPGQRLILEEYCARYGIRECQQHLVLLKSLLDKAERGLRIDPDLIHISYSLCANHVTGKTHHDQAVHTVLAMEREQFQVIKQRLTNLLEKQITEFRYCFPFGRPEGALEKTIGLLERVLTKETGEPASADVVRNAIRICLRNAAVLNYERISEYATIEASSGIRIQGMDLIDKRMNEIVHLAELCIEVLKQNEEHHAESFAWFSDLFVAHAENFWSLFQMDLFEFLDKLPPQRWEVFDIFQLLNDYLANDANLCNGHFHQNLANRFAPLVDRYVELMAESIEQALISGYQNERWLPAGTVMGGLEINGSAQRLSKSQPSSPYTMPERSPATSARCSMSIPGKESDRACPTGEYRSVLSTESVNPVSSAPACDLPFAAPSFVCSSSLSNMTGSRACQTAVELIWRLHKLKNFIQELAWPQTTKAKSLDEQIRVLCAQMLREAVKRTLIELELTARKCPKTLDLVLPVECCTMFNTITELRAHLFSLCRATELSTQPGGSSNSGNHPVQTANQLHVETEEFFESVQRSVMVIIVDQLIAVLNTVLNKLTRFDENRLISSILTLTKPLDEDGRGYATFLHANLQQLSQNFVDEVATISLCEMWYTRQMRMIYEWLVYRKSILLHPYQIKCLSTIVKKIFSYFELQGLQEDVLNTIAYQTVSQRLQVEETTQTVRQETASGSSSGGTRRRILGGLGGGLSALTGNSLFNRN
ncbi:unnamed protein product [Calicophoron daubneyi]|uniref:Calcium-dependent secretion activator 1 n=1 Tax=Calicophoron daubneyi TaxID=300641 RepID=A0AAV2TIG5_CALDB